ncbi:hypothetical protein SAMN04488511_110123 [Pedobacter suwonensis]|uniref:Uncharacterized protein n=1 Tax=Pedobacter suwonensis TaxID=332999 RepID=A0A1I0TIT4_9SPHI|nr:hypothetical protein [Pedobacter suwonensis]SFA51680.1 hypothetical protein SAMN04488511_110123 [Pedobacter suwonensis]
MKIYFLLSTLLLALISDASFAQKVDKNLKMTSNYGTEDKELNDLLRFDGIDFYKIRFSGIDLKGKSYSISVKEFWKGKMKSEKKVFGTKDLAEAGLDKINDTTLEMKVISKMTSDNKIKISFVSDKFSNTKEYKGLKTKDYSLRNLAEESKLPITYGGNFYFMAIILPYEREDGSKSWCQVGSNGKDIENWGKKYGVRHYLLFLMKFE